eukprot:TRINITY_DN8906_c0_g1_i1.p1 TRINITY_DN8906_c0_g1~~TRINITY_DN8906_c0_g1_i1.p1  ORF type:complete len:61 (+),score=16.68 TRINITY_DN8906_c0_g1_i1:28-210(+)
MFRMLAFDMSSRRAPAKNLCVAHAQYFVKFAQCIPVGVFRTLQQNVISVDMSLKRVKDVL